MSRKMTIDASEVQVGDVLMFGGKPTERPVETVETRNADSIVPCPRVIIRYGVGVTSAPPSAALTVLRP